MLGGAFSFFINKHPYRQLVMLLMRSFYDRVILGGKTAAIALALSNNNATHLLEEYVSFLRNACLALFSME